jgi:hypothetical protein
MAILVYPQPWHGSAAVHQHTTLPGTRKRLPDYRRRRRRAAPRARRRARSRRRAAERHPAPARHTHLGITSIYLQGIDNAEIIATVNARRAPMIPATTGLRF